MDTRQIYVKDDEISIKEIFLILWAHKILIFFITSTFIFIGLVFSIQADKYYTAKSTFVLETGDSQSNLLVPTASSRFGAISALAGLGIGDISPAEQLIERVTAREFILKVSETLELESDPLFNNYSPNSSGKSWKATIKDAIGWSSPFVDPSAIVRQNILKNFNEYIKFASTETGAVEVTVRHRVPQRASQIVNTLVSKIVNEEQKDKIDRSLKRLSYLSKEMAESLIAYDKAQANLKNFALANSTEALQSFAAGSVILDDLRSKREKNISSEKAIDALINVVKDGISSKDQYRKLRQDLPLLDDSSFRRILGIPETIGTWTWPSLKTLERVKKSIQERNASLSSLILKTENDAARYARSADEMSKLTRELKIAEATYAVLIEQVKAHSLVAGFTPDKSKIIAVADIPISPSEPRRLMILGIAAVIGLFGSSTLSWALALRNGRIYSRDSLLKSTNAEFNHRVKRLKWYKPRQNSDIQKQLRRRPLEWPRQVFLECSENPDCAGILVLDLTKSKIASTISRLILMSSGIRDRNRGFINLSQLVKTDPISKSDVQSDDLAIFNIQDGCTEYSYEGGAQNVEWLMSKSLKQKINELLRIHEFIIISAEMDVADFVLASSAFKDFSVVIYAKQGQTTSKLIEKVKKECGIRVCLHDR